MTLKEKAEELVGKYKNLSNKCNCKEYYCNCFYVAEDKTKECALIAVDELISQMLCLMKLFNEDRSEFEADEINYWNEVKKEIENL